jgi:hypothetical protein
MKNVYVALLKCCLKSMQIYSWLVDVSANKTRLALDRDNDNRTELRKFVRSEKVEQILNV